MAKYAVTGGYTAEAWSAMIANPSDRMAALKKLTDAMGAKVDGFYWSFGEDDFLAIVDAPDDITAGAIAVAVGSSGALRNVRTTKLITLEDGQKLLQKARAAQAAYAAPTKKQPAGVS